GTARETQGDSGSPALDGPASIPAQPATRKAPATSPAAPRNLGRRGADRASGELDVGHTLVLAAVGVLERDTDLPGLRGPEREREERVLADRLRGLELGDRLVEIRDDHPVDEVVVLVHDLAVLALDDLHRVDHQHADLDDVALLDARRQPHPDAPD